MGNQIRIGVVGCGVVGSAVARTYLEWASEVRVYDKLKERCSYTLYDVLHCDVIFICLPTPQKGEGSLECDVSALHNFFQTIPASFRDRNFVLRSTVPVGTTFNLMSDYYLKNILHSPEFLTARCAFSDALMPSRNIIGVPDEPAASSWSSPLPDGSRPYDILGNLYRKRFPGVPLMFMSSHESEAVKLVQNAFFAVKVGFFNEVNLLIDQLGLKWDVVLGGVLADGRISQSHTQVPGPDGKFGFGGTCLPKDLANLIFLMNSKNMGEHSRGSLITTATYLRNIHDRERRLEA